MVAVTLFTKEGCHLCEDVKADLAALADDHPHSLHEVDITTDPALFERYRYTIPVVHIGEQELHAPITTSQLETALRAARG